MKTTFAITIATLILGPVVWAQTDAPRTTAFKRLDKNSDGKLTREESPAANIFDGADGDKDGLLTSHGIAAYFRKQQSGTPATPSKPGPQPAPGPASAPVAKVDIVETLNVPYAAIAGVEPELPRTYEDLKEGWLPAAMPVIEEGISRNPEATQ